MFDPSAIDAALRRPDDPLLARVEEAGLNASQPREQLLYDGWLLRFSPGKARRSRSINAIAAGTLPLARKLETCGRWYRRFGLPLLFRLTPFSPPPDLDAQLAAAGYVAFDQTMVMTRPLAPADADRAGGAAREVDASTFATAVGRLRASAAEQVDGHRRRLLDSPLQGSSVRLVAFDGRGQAQAAGQVVVEDDLAGLYDIVTAEHERGRGHARAISRGLLAAAARLGAGTAYLQVDAGNAPARGLYASLGFADRYAYWYRQPADAVDTFQPQENRSK
jgi:ribosomal protein S18 acetylase RimI-like enzyme